MWGSRGGEELGIIGNLEERRDLTLGLLIIKKNIMSISDSGPGFIKADVKRF